MLFYVNATTTFDRIACRTGSTFNGTSSVRLGVYNSSSTTFQPTTVAFDAGTVSCTAASTTYAITISESLAAGWYWLSFCQQTAPTTANYITISTIASGLVVQTDTALSGRVGYSQTGISGAFATAGTLSQSGQMPIIGLRAA
jgi:hypothetical protein